MTGPKVVVVCPVFNPPHSTYEALAAVGDQSAGLVVVDDGSTVPVRYEGIEVIRLPENRGIAAALNCGIEAAVGKDATHVLTIDQDSRFPPDYVAALLKCEQRARRQGLRPGAVGAVRFSGLRHRGRFHDGVLTVAESIQSGTLFPVAALQSVGGFDEDLVIDAVDTDACLRLQDAGWDVCAAPVGFDHELGQGHFVRFLGRRVWSSNHPPFRRYYITRNGIVVLRRYARRHPRWALVYLRRLVVATWLAARNGDQRPAIRRGVSDGWRTRMGKRWQAAESGTAAATR